MSAFIPTTVGYLLQRSDEFDVTGARLYGQPVKVGLSMVRITDDTQPTSVRADTSGSKSFADENVEQGRALIHPRVVPKINDILVVGPQKLEVKGVRPIYAMDGAIDHYQTELRTWV